MKYSIILFLTVIISNSFAVNEPKSPVQTETKFLRRSQEQAIIGVAKKPEYVMFYQWPCGNSPVETFIENRELNRNTHPFSNNEQQNSQNGDKTYYP